MITPCPKEDKSSNNNVLNDLSKPIEFKESKEKSKIKLIAKSENTNFLDRMKLKALEVDAKIGVSTNLVLIIIAIASSFILLGLAENFFSNFIGVFYPLIGSIKSLETDTLDDDKMWLTYWVCFSSYFTIEMVLGFLLKKIPLYFFIKSGIFVYLYLPYTRGTEIVYKKFIKKMFIKWQGNVDKLLIDLQHDAKSISKNAKDLFNNQANDVSKILNKDKTEENVLEIKNENKNIQNRIEKKKQ